MQLKTLLNRLEKHKGFVYGRVTLQEGGCPRLIVELRPDRRCKPLCSGCGKPAACYDKMKTTRYFQFPPLWGLLVFFAYVMRRVKCPKCGVKVEKVPWAHGKSPTTKTYSWFLAHWAKLLSWKQVADSFRTSWDTVYRSVQLAVEWGLEHRDLTGIRSIGVDEVAWRRGQASYVTVVYQIDEHRKRLLWIGKDRTKATLDSFFDMFGSRARWLRYVASDMWQAYLDVLARRAPRAIHVLDRFHIVARMNEAIDKVRAAEVKRLKADGYEPVLKKSRWCLLKRPDNLNPRQATKLADILRYNLRTVRAYLLKEELTEMWELSEADEAEAFLRSWTYRAMRSQLEPVKKVARTLRKYEHLIINWFHARGTISSGPVEGLNNKLKVISRSSYGFRTFEAMQTALYHRLGKLPEPEMTHTFY